MTSQSLRDGVSGLVAQLRKAAYDKADAHNSDPYNPHGPELKPEDTLYWLAADALESQSHQGVGVDMTTAREICAAHCDEAEKAGEGMAWAWSKQFCEGYALACRDMAGSIRRGPIVEGDLNRAALSPSNTGEKT